MNKLTKQSLLSRFFSDFKNYPQGFHRSGDFSIKEADALEKYGNLIAGLEAGDVEPEDAEDLQFISSLRGETETEPLAIKAWHKYIQRINRPKYGSIYGTKKLVISEETSHNDDSIDEDLDYDDFKDDQLEA